MTMWSIRVEILPAQYRVIRHSTTRYYTDDTLPGGLKQSLGLLMFGAKDKSIGQEIHMPFVPFDAERAYFVKVDENLGKEIFGDRFPHDTRSEDQEQG